MVSYKKIKERIYRISPTYRVLRKFVGQVTEIMDSIKVQNDEILEIKKENQEILSQIGLIKKLSNSKSAQRNDGSFFGGHYNEWRQKRISAYIKHYGISWFKNKTILELGCGYADIGNIFYYLGSKVTVSDARIGHLKIVNERYPHLETVKHDCEKPLSVSFGNRKFDLIIHNGLLYHLDNYKSNLSDCLDRCDYMVLETEVSDCNEEDFIIKTQENKNSSGQSFSGTGSRPSAKAVEKILSDSEKKFKLLNDNSCNSGFHMYDWKIKNTKTWKSGMRRLWFVENKP